MSGTGRTQCEMAAAENSEGDLSSVVITGLPAEAIQAMIRSALTQQEATWYASER